MVVFGLDKIDDTLREKGSALVATIALGIIINALAILIGFSWEACFHIGVAAVSSNVPRERIWKFILGTVVFIFLVPAWRRHILPKEMALETMQRNRRKELSSRDVKNIENEE